jgi:hypothetical protein
MLAMIATVLGGFALMVVHSYRAARLRAAAGQPFQPEGKLRWTDSRPE